MKRTQLAETFATIKGTIVSFISILMFVALGVGVFAGIFWSNPGLIRAAEMVLDENYAYSFQVQFPYGLSNEDLEKLSAVTGIDKVEAGYLSYQQIQEKDRTVCVKVQSLGKNINKPIVKSGTIPTKPDEIAFKESTAERMSIAVGDTVTFVHDYDPSNDVSASGESGSGASSDRAMQFLATDTFKVTALIESPEYLAYSNNTYGFSTSPSGGVDTIAWVVDDAFVAAAFYDGYPLVNVHSTALENLSLFTDAYTEASLEVKNRITTLGSELANKRYDSLHDAAQAKVDEGQAKVDEATKQVEEGEQKIEQGKEQLETERTETQAKLDDARAKLEESQQELDAKTEEYNRYVAEYNDALARVGKFRDDISNLEKDAQGFYNQYVQGSISEREFSERIGALYVAANETLNDLPFTIDITQVTPDNYSEQITKAWEVYNNIYDYPIDIGGRSISLNQAKIELDNARAQLDDAAAQIEEGWAQYDDGVKQLEGKVADAEQQLSEAQQKVDDAREQIPDAEQKVEEGREKVAAMKSYDWTVLSLRDSGGVLELEVLCDVANSLSYSMAALFLIVGLLVAYSSLGRIVRERMTQIGAKKAIGMRNGEITRSFLLYAGLAVVGGTILGIFIAIFIVESIVGNALGERFIFNKVPPYGNVPFALGLFLLELVLIVGAAWLSCRSILRRQAVDLLSGDAASSGKVRFFEKWEAWQKAPLLTQTIINNLFEDKRRVLSTIVSVAGCTALIVTALTLNNDVLHSFTRQYEEVYGFDSIAYLSSSKEGSIDSVKSALSEKEIPAAPVMRKERVITLPSGETTISKVTAYDDFDSFTQIHHVDVSEGEPFTDRDDGIWVTQALRDHEGIKIGDQIAVDGLEGVQGRFTVLGFFKYYIPSFDMVMSKTCYGNAFGTTCVPNCLFADSKDLGPKELGAQLSSVKGFDSLRDDKTRQYGNFAAFSRVSSAVVLIYMILAVLMALVVLLNLDVIAIGEKKHDLIVMMINGYSVRSAKRYIYFDAILLTILGIMLGIVLGSVTGIATVASIEPTYATFVKDINLPAVGIGIVCTFVLAIIMCLVAMRAIPRFDLSDAQK